MRGTSCFGGSDDVITGVGKLDVGDDIVLLGRGEAVRSGPEVGGRMEGRRQLKAVAGAGRIKAGLYGHATYRHGNAVGFTPAI